jgi:hypothetical protein
LRSSLEQVLDVATGYCAAPHIELTRSAQADVPPIRSNSVDVLSNSTASVAKALAGLDVICRTLRGCSEVKTAG